MIMLRQSKEIPGERSLGEEVFLTVKFSRKNVLFSPGEKAFAVCLAQQVRWARAWSYN
jgi:hypothetical protein